MLRVLALLVLAGATPARQTTVEVELQPLAAAAERLTQALELCGAPLSADDLAALAAAAGMDDERRGAAALQEVLDRHCLAFVEINPESRVKASAGPAPRELVQHGWRSFLVKVHNQGAVTAPLRVSSPQAEPLGVFATDAPDPPPGPTPADLRQRFLDIETFDGRPLRAGLSGLEVEYRIVSLHSRDAGRREATLTFDVGQGTEDLGFRSDLPLLFECAPAFDVELEVLDQHGAPSTAAFVVRDAAGRICPAKLRRVPPDFVFHDQVYRASGETLRLAAGDYDVVWSRGPEYVAQQRTIQVRPAGPLRESFQLVRWIDPSTRGWWSGDHHIHAAGCLHFESPSKGVGPAEILRHIVGEDLKVGCVLSWGPCWNYQKTFFDGEVSEFSRERNLLRYDVEVSGFPSSHAGHLALLRLREDDYPGAATIDDWPSWDLPILRWARAQGAVVGFSHAGVGLFVWSHDLPNYLMPGFDSIGANEYIVDVAHDAVDFLGVCNTPILSELNIWYHTLNCGFRTRIAGETDFPCIFGERVGMGRS
ncbi:MAG TPA: CehA/McbA family metallohydrolase, partial [Planctomycetota bacterium]|nr:CehA/McbA family metallohydrolase [Planctomycetota bacterium]